MPSTQFRRLTQRYRVVSWCRAFPERDTDCGVRFMTRRAAERFADANETYAVLLCDDRRGTRPMFVVEKVEH